MTEPLEFKSKDVRIKAMHWDGSFDVAALIVDWVNDDESVVVKGNAAIFYNHDSSIAFISIDTANGDSALLPDHWMIRGPNDFYPCDPDTFDARWTPAWLLEPHPPRPPMQGYEPATYLEDYRARVRSVLCPFCGAVTGESCTYFNDPSNTTDRDTLVPIPYVHDDRSLNYERLVSRRHPVSSSAFLNADLALSYLDEAARLSVDIDAQQAQVYAQLATFDALKSIESVLTEAVVYLRRSR